MGYINRKSRGFREKAHLNWMGGPSYDIEDPVYALRLAASSCFFGEPMYYHHDKGDTRPLRKNPRSRLPDAQVDYLRETLGAVDPREWRGLSPAQLMESAIDKALDCDVERTLQEATRLRKEEFIRVTPQVILVRAANHKEAKGTGLIRQYAEGIISRADEPATQLAYQLSAFGKPIPNSLKKAWRDALLRFNDYQLAKYRMENRVVKTVDVVNLITGGSQNRRHGLVLSDDVNKLVNDKLTVTGRTWEAIISEKGSTQGAWEEALEVMGHMALLRNLRNLTQAGVKQAQYLPKLIAGAEKGRQLPFRYYSAYQAIKDTASPNVLDAVEKCLMLSLKNLPQFGGRVMSLVDNSGSATGNTTSAMGTMAIASIGNLTGVITGMCSEEGYIGIFGDGLQVEPIRKRSSVFDQLVKADEIGSGIGGHTENGIWLFWDKAIKEKEHWDTVFVFSDMQAGHGGLYGTNATEYRDFLWTDTNRYIDVPKLIARYRTQVNPNVLVFLVQIAGYQDTIIPEFYDKTYILGGWGSGILRFVATMANLNTQQ